ncbi:T9SS type A sorting domain-containing protein [bacterium]|nr:MAG: T9SS type A sorting domain-containing protein [bacterium]
MKKLSYVLLFLLLATQGVVAQNYCINCDTLTNHNNIWNLEACYPLDQSVNDLTMKGNDGSNFNAISTDGRKGLPNSAYQFDGNKDYVVLNNLFDYNRRTVSVWFRVDTAIAGTQNIYVSDDPSIANGLTALGIVNDSNTRLIYVVGSIATVEIPVSLNTWYHAAIVVDDSLAYYYLNCELIATGTNNFHKSSNGIGSAVLGGSRDTSTYWFSGSIDDVRIYADALDTNAMDSLCKINCCLTCDSSQSINVDLEACYPFTNEATDETVNSHDGDVHNAVRSIDRYINFNESYYFDGDSDYIAVPELFDYKKRTYSVWFNATNANSTQDVIVSDDPSLNYGLTAVAVINSGGPKVAFVVGGASLVTQSINQNQWYHAVVVVDSVQTRYYLNGVNVGAGTNNFHKSSNGVAKTVIGGARDLTDYWFEGYIDDIKIYSRALDSADIVRLYSDSCCFNGCDTSSTMMFKNATGIRNRMIEPLKLYPNPGNGNFRIDLQEETKFNLVVFDAQGKVVYRKQDMVSGEQVTFDSKPGVYFVKVMTREGKVYTARYNMNQ